MLLLATSSSELQTTVSIPNGITARLHVVFQASVHPSATPSAPLGRSSECRPMAINKFTNREQIEVDWM